MSNAIKSSATSAIAPQGTTAAQPVDWLSRQGSEGQGGNAGSFARWMAQHNPQTQAPIPQASQASPTAQAARAATATPQAAAKTGPGWSTTQQRLATARSQSAMSGASAQAAGQGTAARQAAAQKPAQAQAQAKADAAKSAGTAKVNRPADAQDGTDTQAAQGTQDGHEADAAKADHTQRLAVKLHAFLRCPHAAAHLAGYKQPHEYVQVPALPRTANGKVQRSVLLARLRDGTAGAGG